MIKKLLISLCLLFSISSSFALQKIYIFHINGVNTTQAEANKNREALNTTLNAQSNMIANNGQVDLLYNKEDSTSYCSLCKQLNDVLSQKKYENITLDDYVNAYITDKKLDIKPGTPEYTALKNSIRDKYFADPAFMGNNFGDLLNQFNTKVSTTTYLNEYLKANASNGSKPFILLIPHSQGNLYANNLYKELTEKQGYSQQNLSIFGIASPAASNLGNYISTSAYNNQGYVTSDNDGIIDSLRVLAAVQPQMTVAPANIHISGSTSDITGHGLIPTYLSDPGSRQVIATNTYNILHYFWMSNIYSNFTQTISSGNRILNSELSLVATQDAGSTLSIPGVMYAGTCLNGNPYFAVRDTTYDGEMGSGIQCASGVRGIVNLNTLVGFSDSNRIRIKIAAGSINQKSISYTLRPGAPYQCFNSANSTTLSRGFYNGVIGGSASDQSCERNGYGGLIPPGFPTRAQLLGGVVGSLQI